MRAVLRGRPFRLQEGHGPGHIGAWRTRRLTSRSKHGFSLSAPDASPGVDEAGRGPLAGPVIAAAVILDPDAIPDGLNDSKILTAARREALYARILACAEVSVAHASVEEIDTLNILRASHLAMERAVAALDRSAMR